MYVSLDELLSKVSDADLRAALAAEVAKRDSENARRRKDAEAKDTQLGQLAERLKALEGEAAKVGKLEGDLKTAGEGQRRAQLVLAAERAGFQEGELALRLVDGELPDVDKAREVFAGILGKYPALSRAGFGGPDDSPGSRQGPSEEAGAAWKSGQVISNEVFEKGFRAAVRAAPKPDAFQAQNRKGK